MKVRKVQTERKGRKGGRLKYGEIKYERRETDENFLCLIFKYYHFVFSCRCVSVSLFLPLSYFFSFPHVTHITLFCRRSKISRTLDLLDHDLLKANIRVLRNKKQTFFCSFCLVFKAASQLSIVMHLSQPSQS